MTTEDYNAHNKERNKILEIVGVIGIFIVGIFIGSYVFPTSEIINPTENLTCYSSQESANADVLTSPSSQFIINRSVNERLVWDECRTKENEMCFIVLYNPSMNQLKCICWETP